MRFSAKDIEALKRWAAYIRSHPFGQETESGKPKINQSPDILIGRVADGDTWEAADYTVTPPTLGEYDLEIYDISKSKVNPIILKDTNPYTILAKNLTGSVVTYDTGFVEIKRDKFGNWFLAGAGGDCPSRNEKWLIKIKGNPDGGSFDIHVPINAVVEAITIDYDMTAADVKTAFEGHSELASTDLVTEGGPLPNSSVGVEFIGTQAGTSIIPTRIDKTALTSTEGGLGVDVDRWVPGFPN